MKVGSWFPHLLPPRAYLRSGVLDSQSKTDVATLPFAVQNLTSPDLTCQTHFSSWEDQPGLLLLPEAIVVVIGTN